MNQPLEYLSTVTSKGRVTIPAAVRQKLGIDQHDNVVFRIVDGRIELDRLPMTLDEAYGSVEPLNRQEDFAEQRTIAREERVAAWLRKQSQ